MANQSKIWIGIGTLFVASGFLLSSAALAQNQGKEETLTGTISDTMCGTKHTAGQDPAKCATNCVQSMGAKWALVVGDKVYTLADFGRNIAKLAGKKVKVRGTVTGTTVQVASIAAAS